jgi:hypothetical protein
MPDRTIPDSLAERFEDIARAAMEQCACPAFPVENGTATCQRLWRDEESECLRVTIEPDSPAEPCSFELGTAEGVLEVVPTDAGPPSVFIFRAREGCTETITSFRGTLFIAMEGDIVDKQIALIPTTSVRLVPGQHHRVEVRVPSGFYQLTIPAEPEDASHDTPDAG